MQNSDPQGLLIYKIVLQLLQLGASIEGGADKSTKVDTDAVVAQQDGDRAELDFHLDDDNCLKDMRGSVAETAGLAIGFRLTQVNDMEVLGWPGWMIALHMQDAETAWPMDMRFKPCSTQSVGSSTLWVGNIASSALADMPALEAGLKEAFSIYGSVVGVSVREKGSNVAGKPAWALVSFDRPWAMRQALWSSTKLNGAQLNVKVYQNTLWVGNIVDAALKDGVPAVEKALTDAFARYGEVAGVSVREKYNDESSSRAIGRQSWAVVSFFQTEAMMKALENTTKLNGEALLVKASDVKAESGTEWDAKKERDASLAQEWGEKLVCGSWLKKTRRTKAKKVVKQMASASVKVQDDRYFAIVKEDGKEYLTWGKSDGTQMLDAHQRYAVKDIAVQCIPAGPDGESSDTAQMTYTLRLPPNATAMRSQQAKQAAQEEKAAAKEAKGKEKAAAKEEAAQARKAAQEKSKDAKAAKKAAKEKEKAAKAKKKAEAKQAKDDEFENPNAEPDPKEAAAIKIQAMHRGYAARKETNANGADAGDDAVTEAAASCRRRRK